jgi:pimeloyl-ACP methyl ester carboxylesterase
MENCMKQDRIRAGDIDFAYLECGEGPLVLFLHGFPDNALSWAGQLRYFADRGYRAVAPYMRGYGPTTAPADHNYEPSALAADVRNVLAALSPARPAAIVSMDWGGVATHSALALGLDNVAAAVIMNTAHPYTLPELRCDPEIVHRIFHFYFFLSETAVGATSDPSRMVRYLWRLWSPGLSDGAHVDSVIETLAQPGVMASALAYYRAYGLAGREGRIPVRESRVPVRSIFGSTDPTARYSDREAKAFVNGYERIILDGVGHFPHRERPGEVNDLLLGGVAPYLPARSM